MTRKNLSRYLVLIFLFVFQCALTSSAAPVPPVINALNGDVLQYTIGSAPQIIDAGSNASVTAGDIDDFSLGLLTVTITTAFQPAEDVLGIVAGNGITLSNNQVAWNGTTIASYSGGTNTRPLRIRFNGNATTAAIGALIRTISYHNVNDYAEKKNRTIQFLLSDHNGAESSAANVSVVMISVNHPPVATDDFFRVPSPSTVSIATPGILINDYDPDGDNIKVTTIVPPRNGTLSVAPDGGFSYSPNVMFTGLDSIRYEVADPEGLTSNWASVLFLVGSSTNMPPVATMDTYTTLQEQLLVTDKEHGILKNDTDPNNGARSFHRAQQLTATTLGALQLNPDGSFIYVPYAGSYGSDQFMYKVFDSQGLSDVATVTINITPVKKAPYAKDDLFETLSTKPLNGNVLSNDINPDLTALTASLVTAPGAGTLVLNSNGSFTYNAPRSDFKGIDRFMYQTCTNSGKCDTAWVVIRVTPGAPTVTSVRTVLPNGYYKAGDHISIEVVFDQAVLSSYKPTLSLTLNPANRLATYEKGSGSNILRFDYVVQAGDVSPHLDYTTINALQLNGGFIQGVPNIDAILTLPLPGSNGSLAGTSKLSIDAAPPVITHLTLPTDSLYKTGDELLFTAQFSESLSGDPTVTMMLFQLASKIAVATYLRSDPDHITWRYIVVPGDNTPTGIQIEKIYPGTSQLKDSAGNPVQLTFIPGNTSGIRIDAISPRVTNVTFKPGYYRSAQNIGFDVIFTEPVFVTGTPELPLTIGSITRAAVYTTGSGTDTLHFNYTVQPGENDADGIGLPSFANGTIKDAAGNFCYPSLYYATPPQPVIVDTEDPVIQSVTGPAPGTYTAGQTLTFTVKTSEPVQLINGALPSLPVHIGDTTIAAPLTSSSPDTLVFSYDIAAGLFAKNGLSLGTALSVTPGQITDLAGNPLHPGLNNVAALNEVLVNAVTPVVTPRQVFDLFENPVKSTVIGTLLADATPLPLSNWQIVQNADTDQDNSPAFAIDATTGVLSVNDAKEFDFERTPQFTITVTVSNGANTSLPQTILISLKDVNEAPTIAAISDQQTTAGQEQTVAVTGLSAGPEITQTYTLRISSDKDVFTSLNIQDNQNGTATVKYTLKDEATGSAVVTVTIKDNSGTTAGGTDTAFRSFTVYITPFPVPKVTPGQSFEIWEHPAQGAIIGTLWADAASRPPGNWQIVQNADTDQDNNPAFAIDAATGVLSVNDAKEFNFKHNPQFRISVTVSNGISNSLPETILISLKDVNEAPTIGAIPDQQTCSGGEQTVAVTGLSTGPETTQTYTLRISSDKDQFDRLAIKDNRNGTATVTYTLKTDVGGSAIITVTIKDNGGTVQGGIDTAFRSFRVNVAPLPVVRIVSDKAERISKGDIVTLTASGATTYTWDFADGIIGSQNEAVLRVQPLISTTYTVNGYSAAGCVTQASVALTVTDDYKVDATNILTPNGDGKNDRWVIRNISSYPNNTVKIFDRSGRMVYTKRGYQNEWDGTTNGHPLAEGTYYYILEFGQGLPVVKGYITLIRDKN